ASDSPADGCRGAPVDREDGERRRPGPRSPLRPAAVLLAVPLLDTRPGALLRQALRPEVERLPARPPSGDRAVLRHPRLPAPRRRSGRDAHRAAQAAAGVALPLRPLTARRRPPDRARSASEGGPPSLASVLHEGVANRLHCARTHTACPPRPSRIARES